VPRPVFKSGPYRPVVALPDDELWMTRLFVDEFGLQLLADGLGGGEIGLPYPDPLDALPTTLPSAAEMRKFTVPGMGTLPEYDEWWYLTYLDPALGPVNVERQAPPPRISEFPDWLLRFQIASDERTLQFTRSHWHVSTPCLIAGGFTTTAPADSSYVAAVERVWAECVELDPYGTFPVAARVDDDDERLLALPAAAKWIAEGGMAFHAEFIA
jgi:hypothetical protein